MTHLPTTDRTWHSETLDRRIKLSEVPMLSEAELATFRLELQDASSSIRAQIETLGDAANAEWRKRANGKQRVTHLFVVACGQESYRREEASRMERARLKTERVIESTRQRDARSSQYARIFHGLVVEEIGPERAEACRKRANQIVDVMIEQRQ